MSEEIFKNSYQDGHICHMSTFLVNFQLILVVNKQILFQKCENCLAM